MLAVPAGRTTRRRRVAITWLGVADALDALVDLPAGAPCGPSVHAWASATPRRPVAHRARPPAAHRRGRRHRRLAPRAAGSHRCGPTVRRRRRAPARRPLHRHPRRAAGADHLGARAARPLRRCGGRCLRAHPCGAHRRGPPRLRRPRAHLGHHRHRVVGDHRHRRRLGDLPRPAPRGRRPADHRRCRGRRRGRRRRPRGRRGVRRRAPGRQPERRQPRPRRRRAVGGARCGAATLRHRSGVRGAPGPAPGRPGLAPAEGPARPGPTRPPHPHR